MKKPQARYKLVWWKTGDSGDPSGEEEFDLGDYGFPHGHPMENTDMSRRYQQLYESPDVYKVEIWQFFAGFHRDA